MNNLKSAIRNLSPKTSRKLSITLVILGTLLLPILLVTYNLKHAHKVAAWFDESFLYRQITTVTNAGKAQADFQVSITMDTATLITANKMQADCDDIRVTDINGKILPHRIEEGSAPCNNSATKIWVKIPSIPTTSQALYIYYGNTSAPNIEDAQAVFNFYDDFNTNAVDTSKWQVSGSTNPTFSNGAMTIGSGALYTRNTILPDSRDYIYEYRTKWASTAISYSGLNIANAQATQGSNAGSNKLIYSISNASTSIAQQGFAADGTAASYNILSNSTLYTPTANTYYVDGFSMDGTQVKYYNDATTTNTSTGSWTAAPYLWLGYFSGSAATTLSHTVMTVDWVRVRKYAPTAPSASTAASEEKGPGPIDYWKLDDGYGSTAKDSGPKARNGTLNGNAAWKTEDQCVSGKCLFLDGTGDFVQTASFVGPQTAVTFEGWFNPIDSTPAVAQVLMGHLTVAATNAYMQFILNTNGAIIFRIAETNGSNVFIGRATVAGTAESNVWQHYTGTWDGGTTTSSIKIYKNGKRIDTSNSELGVFTTINPNSHQFDIGAQGAAGGNAFQGFADEIKIYDYARSAAQVKTDYAASKSGLAASKGAGAVLGADEIQLNQSLSNGLVGYWKLDESSTGSSAITRTDSSGNGNSLTDNNTTASGTGRIGKSADFELSNSEYLSVTDNDTLSTGDTDFTVATWVNLESKPASQMTLVSKWAGATNNREYDLLYDNTTDAFQLIVSPDGTSNTTTVTARNFGSASTNTWYFVTAWHDSANNQIGISINDGTSNTTTHLNGSYDGTGSTILGAIVGAGGTATDFLDGRQDEVRIYKRLLSTSERTRLYEFGPPPVAYWNFDENGTSGSGSVPDISTNAKPLTWNGTGVVHTWNGKFGSAGNFNGASDYLQNSTNIQDPAVMTITGWYKPANMLSKCILYMEGTTAATFPYYQFQIDTTGLVIYGSRNDANGQQDSTASTQGIVGAQWNFVAMSKSEGNITYYVNGQSSTATVATAGTYDNIIHSVIGALKRDAVSSFCNGQLDDIRVYNYARSEKQITQDMNASHPAGGSPVGSQVAYWKFDETSGTVAHDSTPKLNDLTLSTASWSYNGKYGSAWNGTGAVWLTRSDDVDFDFAAGDNATISLWFKSDSATNPTATEYLVDKESSSAGYAIYANTSGKVCAGVDDDSTWGPDDSACSTADIYDGAWHYVGMTKVGTGNLNLYVDGLLNAQDTSISSTGSLANSASLTVGDRDASDNGDEFNGDIDNLKIYRLALNANEIKIDYNANSAVSLGSVANQDNEGFAGSSPTGWWKMDENSGVTVIDSSGNGLNATSTGAVWSPGKSGSAIEMEAGKTRSIILPSSSTYTPTSGSVSMWIYLSRQLTSGEFTTLFNTASSAETFGVNVQYYQSAANCPKTTYCLNWRKWTPEVDSNSDIALPTKEWIHFETTWDGTNSNMYLDGQHVASFASVAPTGGTAAACIGGDSRSTNCAGQIFPGLIDDVRFYNYVRSDAQRAYDFNRGAPFIWYKFDECQGPTAFNSAAVGTGFSSKLNGALTIGGSGTQTISGVCSGTGSNAWFGGLTGKRNSSLNFDGTDDYVEVTDNNAIDIGTGSFSIATWIKPTNDTADGFITIKRNANNRGYDLYHDSSGKLRFEIGDGTTTVTSTVGTTKVNDNNWHHVTMVVNRASNIGQIWVDGHQEGANIGISSVTGTLANASNLQIGRQDNGTSFFTGQIDDFRIYRYPLTQPMIKQIMNTGAAYFGPSTGSP